jgi:peptidylprolyl isomerase
MKKFYSIIFFIFSIQVLFAQTEITFYTSKGNFVTKMYDTITPITSGNFISLVNAKFYDGLIFHRVINNFVVQGGCPYGTGYGGPGYTIPDEFDSTLSNVQKTISMANSGPNTGGSQFFINLVNNTFLDFNKPPYTSAHPVFGIVISNFSVVQTIGAVPVDANNRPITPVVMDSLRVTFNPYTGIDKNSNVSSINVFPNPAKDFISFNNNSQPNFISDISIYDINGKMVYEKRNYRISDIIYIDNFPDGFYYGQMKNKDNILIFKFIKN